LFRTPAFSSFSNTAFTSHNYPARSHYKNISNDFNSKMHWCVQKLQ